MSIALYNLYELFEGRSYSRGNSGIIITRSFVVETADNEVSPSVVAGAELNGTYIPKLGDNLRDSEGNDLGIACTSIDVQANKSPRIWKVLCRYGEHPGGSGPPLSEGKAEPGGSPNVGSDGLPPGYGGGASGEGPASQGAVSIDDPLARPATVRYFSIKRQQIVTADKNNFTVAIANSAGDAFDPPVQEEVSRLGIQVTRNKALFQADVIATYTGAINSAAWAGNPAKTVKCNDIAAERKYEAGIWFYEVVYSFEIEPKKWNPRKYLNQGAWYLSAGKRFRVRDAAGTPLPRALLKANGDQLEVGGTPVWRSFDVFDELDFNNLKVFS